MPPASADAKASASFGSDERKVFFLSGGNIWSVVVADKYNRIIAGPNNPAVQITKFTARPLVRFFHLATHSHLIFVRLAEDGKNYHLYKLFDDGSGVPQDLTPGDATIEMLGASYDGRYIYYSSNKVHKDKIDVYRYDAQQYISEMVFPNDRDFRVLAWSRDHGRLLLEDPTSGQLMLYDIISTERKPLVKPQSGRYVHALMDPQNHQLVVIERIGSENVERETSIGSDVWKDVAKGEITWVDFSANGKYVIVEEAGKWAVREIGGGELPLPAGAKPLAIAPKETMLVYLDASGKLMLFDIAKKASIELPAAK